MAANIDKLRQLIVRLRAKDGCPWDREQSLETVRAYLLEEAHEAAAAIDGGDRKELRGELGDLIFQAVFIARLAEEEGAFDLASVIDTVYDKMVDRHPHVFGEARLDDAAAVHRAWERRKLENPGSQEVADSQEVAPGGKQTDDNGTVRRRSLLGGVPDSLPALTGAHRMTQKAAGVGFDWPDPASVVGKVHEELGEIEEILTSDDRFRQKEEVGDLLFAVVNLARHLKIDAEAALASANRKFRRRFAAVESVLAGRGLSLPDATLEEMDAAWEEVKACEGTA